MKRYIRASYDPSMPDWLKGHPTLKAIGKDYALSEAKFYSTPMADSLKIMLLDPVYLRTKRSRGWGMYPETVYKTVHNYVYCPEYPASVRGELCIKAGDKHYALQSVGRTRAGKAAYENSIKQVVYMVAPRRRDIRPTPYEPDRVLNGDEYRDKSGYVIPNPEDLYARLYGKYPDRVVERAKKLKPILDQYYYILDAYKDIVTGVDIIMGIGYDIDKFGLHYGRVHNQEAIEYFNTAVRCYGELYSLVDQLVNGKADASALAALLGNTDDKSISYITSEIDSLIAKIDDCIEPRH